MERNTDKIYPVLVRLGVFQGRSSLLATRLTAGWREIEAINRQPQYVLLPILVVWWLKQRSKLCCASMSQGNGFFVVISPDESGDNNRSTRLCRTAALPARSKKIRELVMFSDK